MADRPSEGQATAEEGGPARPVPDKVKAPLTTDTAQIPAVEPPPGGALAFDALDDDWDDEEEEERARRESHHRKQRARRVTGVLALVAAVGAGFLGGVLYQKHDGTSSTTASSGLAALAKRFTAGGTASDRGRAGGFPGFEGAAGGTGSVIGTVTSVSGGTLYVSESSSSALVKVETTTSSTVTAPTTTSVASIQPGDSVVVSGAKQSDGSYMAATITDNGTGTTGSTTGLSASG